MNKKLTTVIALGMAFGFAFSAYGCNNEEDPTTPTPKTENEIYSSVVDSVADFASYTGAMSITMKTDYTQEQTAGTETSGEVGVDTVVISYDPATKNFFMKQDTTCTEKEGTETVVNTSSKIAKLFKNGEQWYTYMKMTEKEGDEEAETEEMSFKITAEYVNIAADSALSQYFDFEEIAETIPTADFATVKSAYETVYAEQLTERQKTDTTAKASASVTATENEGAYETKIATNVEFTEEGAACKYSQDESITVKNDKLSKIIMDLSAEMSRTESGVTMTMSGAQKYEISFSYSFDQTTFDSITVDTTNAQDMPAGASTYEYIDYTVKIGDFTMNCDDYVSSNDTAEESFNDYVARNFDHGAEDYTLAWYTDAACTTAVDWTNKKATDLNGNTYYGKMTVAENKAVVLMQVSQVDNRSEAYKIVFGESYLHNRISSVNVMNIDTENAENNVYEIDREDLAENTVIYVNGVKQADTAENFAIASQGFYVLNYQSQLVNADEDIFAIDF